MKSSLLLVPFLALLLSQEGHAQEPPGGIGSIRIRLEVGYGGWLSVKCFDHRGDKTNNWTRIAAGRSYSCPAVQWGRFTDYVRIDWKTIVNTTLKTKRYHRSSGESNDHHSFYNCNTDQYLRLLVRSDGSQTGECRLGD